MTAKTVFLKQKQGGIELNHPCFSEKAHHIFGRVHLPVAPACNIQCKYCIRKYDCANESRPGITSTLITPEEAVERVRTVVDRMDKISVIGIAGPGDPLANDATFKVFSAIHREFPGLILCVSTNGLLLPERLDDLMRSGVRSISITLNAVTPGVAGEIYSWAVFRGQRLAGKEAAKCIVANQWRGLRNAVDAGFIVKVNTVFIPGVNDAEIPLIAWGAGKIGADIMNIMPLLPQAELSHVKRPSHEMIAKKRAEAGMHIRQMTHCRQCRADAFGAIGEDGDIELEVLNAQIGEDYCEMVT